MMVRPSAPIQSKNRIVTGDHAFDKACRVAIGRPDEVEDLLTNNVRQAILNLRVPSQVASTGTVLLVQFQGWLGADEYRAYISTIGALTGAQVNSGQRAQ